MGGQCVFNVCGCVQNPDVPSPRVQARNPNPLWEWRKIMMIGWSHTKSAHTLSVHYQHMQSCGHKMSFVCRLSSRPPARRKFLVQILRNSAQQLWIGAHQGWAWVTWLEKE
jgi:hypothetical protein